jgi:hypothetical protein
MNQLVIGDRTLRSPGEGRRVIVEGLGFLAVLAGVYWGALYVFGPKWAIFALGLAIAAGVFYVFIDSTGRSTRIAIFTGVLGVSGDQLADQIKWLTDPNTPGTVATGVSRLVTALVKAVGILDAGADAVLVTWGVAGFLVGAIVFLILSLR